MARIISYRIVAKEKFTAVAQRVVSKAAKVRRALKNISAASKDVTKNWKKMGDSMKSMGRKMTLFSGGIIAFGVASLIAAGKTESLRASFDGITGSAELGGKLMKELYDFAAKTPFEIEGLGTATKLLLATGTASKDVISTMEILGDIASVAGGDVQGLALVYSQIRNAPTLKAQDANQLINRGIDIYGGIAERLSTRENPVNVAMVRKGMESGLITSKLAISVIRDLNKEGSVAFRAMENQSKTLPGLWSNVKDVVFQTMSVIGEVISEQLDVKGLLRSVSMGLESIRDNIEPGVIVT